MPRTPPSRRAVSWPRPSAKAPWFIVADIEEPGLADRIRGDGGPRIVYARFFVHAITEAEEESLLDLAAEITDPGDLLAVEYRTVRDSSGAKVTETHYRRFVLPAAFEA